MKQKVVILSGSGLSAESGLPTFRDAAGLWRQHSWQELASPDGWRANPALVLEFYNERRAKAWARSRMQPISPSPHSRRTYDVIVVTQNVDALHERAGSTNVLHVHGELSYARGTGPARRRYRIDGAPIELGQLCEDGTQLRPDIVWFGEETQFMEEAREHVATADKVLVVGTSLSVYPAASLVDVARDDADKVLNSLEMEEVPRGFVFHPGPATRVVPRIIEGWLR